MEVVTQAREASKMNLCGVIWVSALIGFIVCPLYFSYHAPGATEVTLTGEIGLSQSQVGLLFTTYSTPNLVMPAIAGLAMDRFGLKITAVVLLSTLGLGSVIYSLAFKWEDVGTIFVVMNVGRFVQGLAGECLVTWHQAACLFWFSGKHESKSIGVCLAVQNGLGSAASFFVLEWARASYGLEFANWIVFIHCCIAFLGLLVFFFYEKVYSTYLITEMKREVYLYPCILCFCAKGKRVTAPGVQTGLTEQATEEEKVSPPLREVLASYPNTFWLQNMVIFMTITILYTSANFFPEVLVHHYGLSEWDAGICTSLLYFAMLFAPASGSIVDACGRRLWVQDLSSLGVLIGFLLMYLTEISPWVLVPFIGWCFSWAEQNAYSIVAGTFSQTGIDVTHVAGTGFGLMGVFLNGGLMCVPPLVGAIGDAYSPREQMLIYMVFMVLGLFMSLLVRIFDKDGALNRGGHTESETAAVPRPNSGSFTLPNKSKGPSGAGPSNLQMSAPQ